MAPREEVSLKLTFPGRSAHIRIVPSDPLPTRMNYLTGQNARRWRSGVRTYGQVTWRGLYPRVSATLEDAGGRPAVEVHAERPSDLAQFRLHVAGASTLRLASDGRLVAQTAIGPLVLPAFIQTGRVLVAHPIGNVASFTPSLSSVSQAPSTQGGLPSTGSGLKYGTYVGAGNWDVPTAIAMGTDGSIYVTGWTYSSRFPVTPGAFDPTYNGLGDAFVSKFDPTGSSLAYSTFLGGSDYDVATSIAVSANGSAYIAGWAVSQDFPTTPGAFRPTPNGTTDGFVSELDPLGSALVYSSYLGGGGSNLDLVEALALGADGTVFVTGETLSADFPTTQGAYDTLINDDGQALYTDAFVTALNPEGSALVYSTFLGGTFNEDGYGIAVADDGTAYVTGDSSSGDFPTTPGAFDPTANGSNDAFVTKISANGSTLSYSTYLGGSDWDTGNAVALGPGGDAYVTGYTSSADFPTTPGCYDPTINDSQYHDAFVSRLDATGSSVVFSTFFGGNNYDYGEGLVVDADGRVTVAGITSSPDLPTTATSYQPYLRGPDDAYVARFDSAGTTLLYGSFLGGTDVDFGDAVAGSGAGAVSVAGRTYSSDFPTTPGAYDQTYNGTYDAFVATLQVAPTMHVASIDPTYRPDGQGYDVGARIRIVSAKGTPVASAAVTVELDYPDGSRVKLTGTTGAKGKAVVARYVAATGTYTFTVLGLVKPPMVYDPSQNVETSDSVTIP